MALKVTTKEYQIKWNCCGFCELSNGLVSQPISSKAWFRPYYRPQTKFAKVMFLHLSVSHSVHMGKYLGRYPIRQVHPPGRYISPGQVHLPQAGTSPPGRYTPGQVPPGQVRPLGRYTPQQVHSRAGTPWPGAPLVGTLLCRQCMLGYGQQAGGMHPTGMHSCFWGLSLYISMRIGGRLSLLAFVGICLLIINKWAPFLMDFCEFFWIHVKLFHKIIYGKCVYFA